jgi:hypothetical protein
LPRDKRVEIGLTYIHGIGRSRSNEILAGTGVEPDTSQSTNTERGSSASGGSAARGGREPTSRKQSQSDKLDSRGPQIRNCGNFCSNWARSRLPSSGAQKWSWVC